jgi:elongation factor G
MQGLTPAQVRNFTLAGHSGSGKTLLADLMLFKSGKVSRLGRVEDKTSVSDYRPEEQEKRQSLYATPLHCTWQKHALFFIDTPGNPDFMGDACAALSVCDMALIVIDGVSGIEFGTQRAIKYTRARGTPRAFFINGLDKDNASFATVLASLQETYGATTCIPFNLPIGQNAGFSAVYSVLGTAEAPAAVADDAALYKSAIMDAIAESDEELMLKYLDGTALTPDEVSRGLHAAILAGKLCPVFCGSALKDIGITELLNGVIELFPDPLARQSVAGADGQPIPVTADGPGVAFVYKSVLDPFIGQLSYLRVYSGSMTTEGDWYNLTHKSKERIGGLLLTNGKEQETVPVVIPGALLAVAKLKATRINDTLLAGTQEGRQIAAIEFPKPTASFACYATKKGDEDKIATTLHRLADEDPTVSIVRQEETAELLLSGMGDQHLAVILSRVKASAHVDVELRKPKVPYRETITRPGKGMYRHKKQTGGHGQFAEVWLRIEPLPGNDFEFVNEVVGGNIPKNYIPGVEKGVADALTRGPLARCRVINVLAAVTDGKYHPVDSSDMAFQIAGRAAFREAMKQAHPILLEPIMKVVITAPDRYTGDISGDLNHRRGRLLGMNIEEGMQQITAEVPLAEMHSYSSQLRSITQGRGSFDMEFVRYDQVPAVVSAKIQEEAGKEAEEVE